MVGTALKVKPILTFGTEIAPVGRVRTHRRALERMVAYLRELHERGASDWIVQHAQAPADAERLVAEGTRAVRLRAAVLHRGRPGARRAPRLGDARRRDDALSGTIARPATSSLSRGSGRERLAAAGAQEKSVTA